MGTNTDKHREQSSTTEKPLSWLEQYEKDEQEKLGKFYKVHPIFAFMYEWRAFLHLVLLGLLWFAFYQALNPLLQSRIILPDPHNHEFNLPAFLVSVFPAFLLSYFFSQGLGREAYELFCEGKLVKVSNFFKEERKRNF